MARQSSTEICRFCFINTHTRPSGPNTGKDYVYVDVCYCFNEANGLMQPSTPN